MVCSVPLCDGNRLGMGTFAELFVCPACQGIGTVLKSFYFSAPSQGAEFLYDARK